MGKRIEWIDFAKGITIILVIIGHTIGNTIVRGPIFSFHMPLFFLLSLVTYKVSDSLEDFFKKLKKSFHHLIFPAIGIWFIQSILLYRGEEISNYIVQQLRCLFWASGVKFSNTGYVVPPLGMAWFLFVLFSSRVIFDLLNIVFANKKTIFFFSLLLSIFGVALVNSNYWLPFSFDIALVIMPFLLVGSYLKSFDFNKGLRRRLVLNLIMWGTTFVLIFYFTHNYLELASREYPLYPLSFICSLCGIFTLCYFSVLCESNFANSKIFLALTFIGRYSMVLFFIHAMEDFGLRFVWELTENHTINLLIRLSIDLTIFWIYLWRKGIFLREKS